MKLCQQEMRPEFRHSCQLELDTSQQRMQDLNLRLGACAELDEKELDDLRYKAVTEAAQLGDVDAQMCFVQSDFDLRKNHKLSDDDIEKYQIDAISYVTNGLQRGDWRVPQLMTTSARVLSHSRGFLSLVTDADDLTVYKMTRLLSLGAAGDYAVKLKNTLAEYVESSKTTSSGLSAEQLAEGDAWAQDEYRQYFASSPVLTAAPNPCALSSVP
jgi:hypothetical protein